MPTRYCGASGADGSAISVSSFMVSASCRLSREATQQYLDGEPWRDIPGERVPGVPARGEPRQQLRQRARTSRALIDVPEDSALPRRTHVRAQEIAIAKPAGLHQDLRGLPVTTHVVPRFEYLLCAPSLRLGQHLERPPPSFVAPVRQQGDGSLRVHGPETDDLTARQERGRERPKLGEDEDDDRPVGRLLERLQERLGRGDGAALCFVHDEHFP